MEASWDDGRAWLKGRANGDWELECCRCLKRSKARYDVALDTTFEEEDVPDGAVDGLEEIRQAMLLAVPSKPYCRADCKGLCVRCGQDKNEKDCGCVVEPPTRFKITKRGKTDA